MRIINLSILLLAFLFFSEAQRKKKSATVPSATPATDRWQGYQNRLSLEENSLVKNVAFRNVGPTIMSGRVADIAVNPNNPTEFYVGYASGGLWHTNNRYDRDLYIHMNWQNIYHGQDTSFYKRKKLNPEISLPYDYHSLMHDAPTDFSKDDKSLVFTTTSPNNAPPLEDIGDLSGFSQGDVLLLRLLYQCQSGPLFGDPRSKRVYRKCQEYQALKPHTASEPERAACSSAHAS